MFVDSLGPEASKMLALAAHEVQSDVEKSRPLSPLTDWSTDGERERPYEEVRPDGTIFLWWDYRSEVVAACFSELRARSPVSTNHYRESFFVILDHVELGYSEVPTAQQLHGVEEVIITNDVPYSRRLEVGVTNSGAPFVKQVDPHIFESAMEAVRRQYAGVVVVDFNYIDLQRAHWNRTNFGGTALLRRRAKARRIAGQDIRYPAIMITLG